MATKTKQKKKKPATKSKKKSLTKRLDQMPKKTKVIVGIIVALLVAVIVLVGLAINNSNHGKNLLSVNKDVAQGVDVSSHNGNINWSRVAEAADFAIVRVGFRGYSEGELNPDKCAKRNLKKAQKAGMPLGVYVYSQAITQEEAIEEANFALHAIRGYDVSLPVFIDCEYAESSTGHIGRLYDAQLSDDDMTDIVNAFCKTVLAAGYTPGVYASTSFYEHNMKAKDITHKAVIWVADYNPEITYSGKYSIWQFTNKGSCDGIKSKGVDIDYWYLK